MKKLLILLTLILTCRLALADATPTVSNSGQLKWPTPAAFIGDSGAAWRDGMGLANTVLTTGSYADPDWLTTISWAKITGVPSWIGATTTFSQSLLTATNSAAARTTLGLGNSSTLNVGTTSNTVAAGDDSRIVNAVQAGSNNTFTGDNTFSGALQQTVEIIPLSTSTTSAQLTWTRVKSQVMKFPMDDKFITYENKWNTVFGYNNFTVQENPSGSLVVDGGAGTVPLIPYTKSGIRENYGPTFKIPFYTVQVCIGQMGNNGAESGDRVSVGVKDPATGNKVVATYDHTAHTLAFSTTTNSVTTTTHSRAISLNGTFTLSFVAQGACVSAWVENEGRSPVCLVDNVLNCQSVIDLTSVANISAMRPYAEVVNNTGSTPTIVNSVRAGYAGGVGIANQSMITYEDGTPIVKDNKQFFIASTPLSPSRDNFWEAAAISYASVYSIDQDTYEINCTAKYGFLRNGQVVGHNSGNIIFDRTVNKWRLFIPPWSDGTLTGMKPYLYTTSDDILRGVHVFTTNTASHLNLPTDSGYYATYDPDVRYLPTGTSSMWFCAYTQQNGTTFSSKLASCTTLTGSFTAIGSMDASVNNEGSKIRKVGGVQSVLTATHNVARLHSFADYTLTGTYSGYSDSGGVPIHPNIMYIQKNGVTKYAMVHWSPTADYHTLTWGSFSVYEANQTNTGYEFPVIKSIYP